MSNNLQMVQDKAIVTMVVGGLIKSHTWSIALRLFQWSWRTQTQILRSGHSLTLNISKMAADTDTAIVTMKYGSLGRRIGNRTQAFNWYHFQWLWVTSNPHFKVTIIF